VGTNDVDRLSHMDLDSAAGLPNRSGLPNT
jgi:hypothetical protein